VGLNSGEVVVRTIGSDLHMDYTAVGQTTHLAVRMEQISACGCCEFATGINTELECGTYLPLTQRCGAYKGSWPVPYGGSWNRKEGGGSSGAKGSHAIKHSRRGYAEETGL
jgi:hypothetical protein